MGSPLTSDDVEAGTMRMLWIGFAAALTLPGALVSTRAFAQARGRGFEGHEVERWRRGDIAR